MGIVVHMKCLSYILGIKFEAKAFSATEDSKQINTFSDGSCTTQVYNITLVHRRGGGVPTLY